MFMSVFKNGENTSSQVENPTSEMVNEVMTSFGSVNVAFHLYAEASYLIVLKGQKGRVKVAYSDRHNVSHASFNAGILLDTTLLKDNRKIIVNYGTETTREPVYQTIPSEQALEIALHFLEHEAPPRGLTWTGRMDRFQ